MLVNWAQDSKEKDIKKLFELVKKEKDYKRKAYIMQVLDKTRRVFESENKSDFEHKKTKNQLIFELSDEYIGLQRYYLLLFKIDEMFENYEMVIQTNLETLDLIDMEKYCRVLSDEETFTLVHDFFMNTDEVFSGLFSKYINDKYCTIKFSKDEPLLNTYECDGLTYFVDILMKNYILIRDKEGFDKASILAHEVGHALSFLLEPKSHYTFQDKFLSELPSLFFQLAFNYEVVEKLSGIESAEHALRVLEQQISDSEYILLHNLIIEEWKNNNMKVNPDFYKKIRYNQGLSKSMVDTAIRFSITEEGEYIFSYFVSLFLLNIYRQDKKEALKILREILSMYQEDSLITINTFINNFSGVKSEIELINTNFSNEAEKILKK